MEAAASGGADFSEMVEHSRGLVQWAPSGMMLAAVKTNRLTLRDTHTLEILLLCNCADKIEVSGQSVLH
jgi:hypothetical protein